MTRILCHIASDPVGVGIVALVALYALAVWICIRRRNVQIWVGEDEAGPRIGRNWNPLPKCPTKELRIPERGSSLVGSPASQPRHFITLRWIGVECTVKEKPPR